MFWLREFGNGFLVACVWWGFDCKSLVVTFGCASLRAPGFGLSSRAFRLNSCAFGLSSWV